MKENLPTTEREVRMIKAIRRAERHIADLAHKLGADQDGVDAATKYLRDALP